MERLSKLLSNGLDVVRWLAVAVLLIAAMTVSAQTVSISPKTGNVISAASYSGESHLTGFGGVWVHNQLPMTLVSSDKSGLTENRLMSEHANNILASGNNLVFASGSPSTTINHMSLSLPKGYRFTGYKIVMDYDSQSEAASTFKEMDAFFSDTKQSVVVSKGSTGKVLQRTSMSDADMGNILYFRQEHPNGMARVKVTSFVVTFECTQPFTEVLTPGVSAAYGTDCVAMPFATQRVDLGQITRQTATSSGYTSYKYNYANVKDLHANFMLYDNSGITAGTAVEGQVGDGHIVSSATQGDKTYMGLANDTYWLEVPTDALSQDGTTLIPVGYRIVGARLHCAASITSYSAPTLGKDIYIMDNNDRYLNASLNYTTTPVAWKTDTDGRVWTTSGNKTYYLTHDKSWGGSRKSDLKTTTEKNDAREYKINDRGLYWNSDYVGYSSSGTGTYSGTSATITSTATVSGEASAYTVKLYDKTGTTVVATAAINESNPTQEISVDGLNNDAVKFAVEGLADGQTAHVCLEVDLEALNPYIDKMDVVCRQADGSSTSLSNQYLADDFTIGSDGKIEFAVPTNFAADKMLFTFDQLHSKSADNTYGPLSESGNARYHFVRSAYYDLIGENLQAHRTEAADYDYINKVSAAVAGDKAFRCNNSDNYSAGTIGSSTFVYEEYRYANATYASQGGTWGAVQLASGDSRNCYLVTSDETRYNIAPTTTPRHAYYAYYNTNITLKTENYKPELTYTTVYNNATLSSGLDSKKWVGVSVALRNTTTDALLGKGEGYAYAKQIVDQINTDIANGKTGAPADTKHILYLDASGINSVLYSADDATLGTIDDIRDVLATNAMIYLPKGVSYKANNVASLSISGDDYVAENDIVLTDQQPFFAPFDIRVNAANEVRYTRLVTLDHTDAQWLSLALPFTVAVDANGQYANDDDQCAFTFYKMNENNALDNMTMANSYDYKVDGHFSPLTSAVATDANTPYLVGIDQAQTGDDASKMVFTVRQKGSTIVKTPVTADNPLLTGEEANATVGGKAATLTAHASFCGVSVPKGDGIFYFNKSHFASSLNLDNRFSNVYVMPFRGYYNVVGLSSAVRFIAISLVPGSSTTGIDALTDNATDTGFQYTISAGQLTVTANKDISVKVRNVSGQTIDVTNLKAGESRSVALPGGIYIVNGKKVVVR